MKTLNTTKIIAAALLFTGLSAATTSAMADEYVSAQNKEAYAVAAGKYDDQALLLPANAAPTILERHQANSPSGHARSASPAATIPGPFADPDPHSGPAHGG